MAELDRQLNRLRIIGDIVPETPLCVLKEIADAHGILTVSESNIVAEINRSPIVDLSLIEEENKLHLVARYINHLEKWPLTKLLTAYNYSVRFEGHPDPLSLVGENPKFGSQTPENPESLNYCMLYAICRSRKINTSRSTSPSQLIYAFNLLRDSRDSLVRRIYHFCLHQSKEEEMISFLCQQGDLIDDPEPEPKHQKIEFSPHVVPEIVLEQKDLLEMLRHFNDIQVTRRLIVPVTRPGSISLAALNYDIDISYVKEPCLEYKNIRENYTKGYQPIDPWMRYWYQRNPRFFDLRSNFSPHFPGEFYSSDILMNLARYAGYSARYNDNTNYENICSSCVIDTFYQGDNPFIYPRQTSFMMDDLDKIDPELIISYGIYGCQQKALTFYEIYDLFNENSNFSNPFQMESLFSDLAIAKLISICEDPYSIDTRKPQSEEIRIIKGKLLDLIMKIDVLMKEEPKCRELVTYYNSSSKDEQIYIVQTLKQILEISMYMRGWLGPGNPYPIGEAPERNDKIDELSDKINRLILENEEFLETKPKIKEIIGNLPLVRFKDRAYIISKDAENGLTIGDRLKIVVNGNVTENINSCIRLSSNWLASSAHKYLIVLGMPAPFPINSLSEIY